MKSFLRRTSLLHSKNNEGRGVTALQIKMMQEVFKRYVHNPAHLFLPNCNYIITGATLYKAPIIQLDGHKKLFVESLFRHGQKFDWQVQVYSVMNNHYHFLALAPENAGNLSALIRSLHRFTAKEWNRVENCPGRRVWYNYWDTCITSENSYFSRFNYIHYNPVRHGLADNPEDYPWSSYRVWIEENSPLVEMIEANYAFDQVKVIDDF